ncbi:hypothetical protein OS493_023493 [Desmophyllum pertusum]|uniref:Uncharacterized protein n=1 Tax=Desmophyllum pertusum TaxID=174260 RepID=A0A9X0D452_9CNID|nr:hypothetical protein OS493_023493 [Desmophyllum pertusum]
MFVLSVKECKKIDSCSCSTDEGEISLKKLAGTDGKPRFSQIFLLENIQIINSAGTHVTHIHLMDVVM